MYIKLHSTLKPKDTEIKAQWNGQNSALCNSSCGQQVTYKQQSSICKYLSH